MRIKNLVLILAVTLAACKGEPPAAPPELAAPDKAFSTPEKEGPWPVKAEAVVTASSGPIQLTLRLYKTKIKAETSLWYQLELKNIGKTGIFYDEVFRHPAAMKMHDSDPALIPFGTYLEVTDEKGNLVNSRLPEDYNPDCMPEKQRDAVDAWGMKIQKILREGEKKNLSADEIDKRVSDFHRKHRRAEMAKPRQFEDRTLPPSSSVQTPPWAYQTVCDEFEGNTRPKSLAGYTELPKFLLWVWKPGKYRVRAGYNHEVPNGPPFSDRRFRRRFIEDVRFTTAPMEFEVLP